MSLIQVNNASFRYDGKEVVGDLHFTIERGDYLCIVGENGSGKSTLVKGLLGLKQPSDGSITFGESLTARQIGYLPQQRESQRDFPASVQEVVLSGTLNSLGLFPFYRKKQRENALAQLRCTGSIRFETRVFAIFPVVNSSARCFARALAATKNLLILDEPIAGLDPLATADMYRLIEHVNRDHGVTVIMVSHDLQAAVHAAKRILHLENRQLFFGTTEEYRNSEIGMRFLNGGEPV